MSSEPENPTEDLDSTSEKDKGNSHNKRASAATLIDAFAQQYQADRKEAGRREGHRIFREWLTIIGLFIAAIVAGFQWSELRSTDHSIGKQAELAKAQLDVMQNQTRPWMKGEFGVSSISKDERGQLNLQFSQRMLNIGNQPAAIAFIGAVFMPDPGVKVAEKEKELCETLGVASWKNALKWPFMLAFPNEWTRWENGAAIVPANLIKEWQKAVLEEKNIKEGDPKPVWISRIPLVYIGCITYGAQATPDAAIHQTGFVFQLPGTFDVSDSGPVTYNYPPATLAVGFYSSFEHSGPEH